MGSSRIILCHFFLYNYIKNVAVKNINFHMNSHIDENVIRTNILTNAKKFNR